MKTLILPVARRLCFQDLSSQQADYILRMMVGLHSATLDSVMVPQLLDCLRTPNADIRLRIHRTLEDLQRADYPVPKQPLGQDLLGWVPKQDESPGIVETCVEAWAAWWAVAWGEKPATILCEGNRVPIQGSRGSPNLSQAPGGGPEPAVR